MAFEAYVARQGTVFWRRALLLAAGDREVAERLVGDALAGTYAWWRDDSDDAVETPLALRAMARAAAHLGDLTGDLTGEVTGDASGQGPDGGIEDRTARRLAGLDGPARAALVAHVLDGVARALERHPRDARADLARALAAWPADTGDSDDGDSDAGDSDAGDSDAGDSDAGDIDIDVPRIARELTAWLDGLDAVPSPGLAGVMQGITGSRGRGGFSGSSGPRSGGWLPRVAALGLVGAVLVGAAAASRQLAPSPGPTSPGPIAPGPPTYGAPGTGDESAGATADSVLREPSVGYDDLAEGAPARPRAYLARDGAGRLSYVDGAGRVALPGAGAVTLIALTPVGAFLVVSDTPAAVGSTARLQLVRSDRTLVTVLPRVGEVAGLDVSVAPSGEYVAYLRDDPAASLGEGRAEVRVVRVADAAEIASSGGPGPVAGLGWIGGEVAVLQDGQVHLWRPGQGRGQGHGWRAVTVGALVTAMLPVGDSAVIRRSGEDAGPTCLRRWRPDGADEAADLWCVDAAATPWAPAPAGRRALVMLASRIPAVSSLSWGVVNAATGEHAMLGLPGNAFVFGRARGPQAWEDDEHVLFVGADRTGQTVGLRCAVATGRCEKAALPADLAPAP